MSDGPALEPLTPGRLAVHPHPATSVHQALDALADTSPTHPWQGEALTTGGPLTVTLAGHPPGGLRTVGQQPVDLRTVYALRLWVPTGAGSPPMSGQEWRWESGHPHAAHLVLSTDQTPTPGDSDGQDGEPVLLRPVVYLQRGHAGAALTAVEVFVVEPRYGNVEARDEITTGTLEGL